MSVKGEEGRREESGGASPPYFGLELSLISRYLKTVLSVVSSHTQRMVLMHNA